MADIAKALANNAFPFLFDFELPKNVNTVVMYIRLPRILAAVLVGAMLALAGASYQSIFRNPLVSPDILGASAGASFGAAVAIFSGLGGAWIQLFAFGFSIAAIGITYLVASHVKRDQVLALILAGMVVAALCNAFVSLIKFVADPNDKLPAITYWLMGSLANTSLELAGGVNVARDCAADSGKFFADVDPEKIVEWNPDMLFVINFTGGLTEENDSYQEWASDERYAGVTAMETGDVYLIPTMLEQWDASSQAAIGVTWMAKVMYPDLFEDVDIKALVNEFYKKFLGLEVAEEDWAVIAPQYTGAKSNGLL